MQHPTTAHTVVNSSLFIFFFFFAWGGLEGYYGQIFVNDALMKYELKLKLFGQFNLQIMHLFNNAHQMELCNNNKLIKLSQELHRDGTNH